MATQVDIYNIALTALGLDGVTDPIEDSEKARVMNRLYEPMRDTVLRGHPWNCAINRVQLAAEGAAPAFGYGVQYALPTDPYCLRVLKVNELSDGWAVEGRKLRTDLTAPIDMVYIGRVASPEDLDAMCAETIALRMAWAAAYRLTESRNKEADAKKDYMDLLKLARSIDGQESGALEVETDDWTESRL